MSFETWLIVSGMIGVLIGIGAAWADPGDEVDRAQAFIAGAVLTFGLLGVAGLGVSGL